MIGLCIVLFIWLALVLVALRFAKKAGEQDWGAFTAFNLIPIVGSIFSMVVYCEMIAKNEGKLNK